MATYFIIFYQRSWKMYFLLFQDLLNKIMLIWSKNVICHSMAFKCPRYKKVFLDENKIKLGFHTWKTPKSHTNIKMFSKKNPEWFSIKTIDPICFMKMLWSISAQWCFQKIGSGLALWWSDTPQYSVNFPSPYSFLITFRRMDMVFVFISSAWFIVVW